jgi:HK97 family phage major capsid protein
MPDTTNITRDEYEALMKKLTDVQSASIASANGQPTNDDAARNELYKAAMGLKYGQQPNLGQYGVSVVALEEDDVLPKDPKKVQKMLAKQMTEDRAIRTLENLPNAEEFALACDYLYMVKGYLDAASRRVEAPTWKLEDTISYRTVQAMWKSLSKTVSDKDKRVLASMGMLRKAMDSATSTEGAEYIPTGFSNQVHRLGRVPRKVAGLFTTIQMPTDPWKWPLEAADAVAYLTGESTSDTATKFTATTPGTGNITFASKKFAARVLWSADLEEDSIVAIAPYVAYKVDLAHTDATEQAILNGDTTGTHQDSDTTNAADARKAWKGLRKLALQVASNGLSLDLSTFNTTGLRNLRKKMGKYGIMPDRLAWIASINSFYSMLGLSEVLTIQNYGNNATVVTGELAKFDGIPIVVSEFQRQDLNATGVYDGTTTTKTGLGLVNLDQFMIGRRRGPTMITDNRLYLETDQVVTVATQRQIFVDMLGGTSATNSSCAFGYNM